MTQGPILIVDDDRTMQEIVTLALGDDYDLRHAATAGEALSILQHETVAAMVLDYRLPDRTGLDVLSDVRSMKPCLPVIMMTGYGSEWICASAFKLGVIDYFPKPLNVFDLVHSVGQALNGPSGDGASQPSPPAERSGRRPDMAIQKAAQLIHHRYWDRLSLAQLARETGMSKSRLSHRFTQVMGLSLREYLLRVRLQRAQALLAAGHVSITEVAQAVGFGDLPRFDKVFRRHTGVTPSAYRSQNLARRNN